MRHSGRSIKPLNALTVVLLAAALGIGVTSHAQNGRQAQVTYQLRMSTAEEEVCLDHVVGIPVTVEAIAHLPGHDGVARVHTRGIAIEASSPDASIVTVEVNVPVLSAMENEPMIGGLRLTGLSVGRTTITVDVTIVPNSPGAAPVRRQASLPVRVIPCEYRIDLGSVWVTRLHNADYFIAANARNIRIVSIGGTTLANDFPLIDNPPLRWNMTINRIRGCEVGNPMLAQPASPDIRAEVLETMLSVSITYTRLVPWDVYYIEACRVEGAFQHSAPCPEHPDGVCFVWDDGPEDWFEPQTVEYLFPLDGGTATVPHRLIHAGGGNVDGGINITVTPIRRQQ